MDNQGEQSAAERDHRPRTTGWIWFWATMMMGPSVPVAYFTHSAALPLFVVAAAALSTITMWVSGGSQQQRTRTEQAELQREKLEAARLKSHVQELEERLFALETMTSYERAAAHRAAQQNAPHQSAAPFDSPFDPPQPQRDPLLPSQPVAPRRVSAGRGVSIAQD